MRIADFSRRLLRETAPLSVDDLIEPMFVMEGTNKSEAVTCMPGIARHTLDRLSKEAHAVWRLGIPAIALFPVVPMDKKSDDAGEAVNSDGLIPRACALLKKKLPELGIITDVALDPYTTHGQDGYLMTGGTLTTTLRSQYLFNKR